MKIQNCFLALIASAMAGFLLFHFAMIWVYGKFYIFEPNLLILGVETTVIVAILAFSFYCFVEQLRRTGQH